MNSNAPSNPYLDVTMFCMRVLKVSRIVAAIGLAVMLLAVPASFILPYTPLALWLAGLAITGIGVLIMLAGGLLQLAAGNHWG